MTSTTRRGAVTAALLAGALAAPAAASAAPTLALDRECYTPAMPIRHTGGGYSPGGEVRFFAGWEGRMAAYSATADAAGALDYTIGAPDLDSRRTTLSITANDAALVDQGAPPDQAVASAQATLSEWNVSVQSWDGVHTARAKPGRRTRVRATGWIGVAGTRLYAHYLRGRRLVKTVAIGRVEGICGDLDARMREFPFKAVRPGTYSVRFDTTRPYPNNDAFVGYKRVVVGRGAGGAAAAGGPNVERRRAVTPRPPRPAWRPLRAAGPGPAA
jgi:hypothetical protein